MKDKSINKSRHAPWLAMLLSAGIIILAPTSLRAAEWTPITDSLLDRGLQDVAGEIASKIPRTTRIKLRP